MHTRIKEVLDYSRLNQQEFAERISIAPASLSNILKGRVAKLSTDLVMSIANAYPEINPLWLISGRGEMLLPQPSAENAPDGASPGESSVTVDGGQPFKPESQGTLFDLLPDEGHPGVRNGAVGATVSPGVARRNGRAVGADEYAQRVSHFDPSFNAQNPALYGMNFADRKPRRIKEIRVYFDDDTFEVFSPFKS